MKIGVCVPITVEAPRSFIMGLLQNLTNWITKYDVSIWFDPIIPVDRARNNLVETALKNKCNYVFFIDSDVQMAPGTLEALLSDNVDIVSAVVFEKTFPHPAIVKKQVAPNLYSAYELELNKGLVEVDGIGMGCCLIKCDVFRKLRFPWFKFVYYNKYGRWYQLSEDLYFCQQAKRLGYKIFVDTNVTVGHFGALVTQDDYLWHRKWRKLALNIRDNIVEEVAEFTKEPKEEIYYKLQAGQIIAKKEWEKFGQEMYRKSKDYIYDLAGWHVGERMEFDIKLIQTITNMKDVKTILDFGCGIGQNAIMLAATGQWDVYMTDTEGPVAQFARWRASRRSKSPKWIDLEELSGKQFDLVLCFDVLEHIPDDQFEQTIELLKKISRKIIVTTNFGKTEEHPMHYDSAEWKMKLIQTLPNVEAI